MTQQQLAEGRYTKAYISALEKGHAKPSMAALNFISDRLGLPPSRFLSDSSSLWTRMAADLSLASADWSRAIDGYEALLEGVTDRGTRAEMLLGLAEARIKLERGDLAIASATEAMESFAALGRTTDAAWAAYWLSGAHAQVDNRAEARALLADLLADVRRQSKPDPDFKLRVLMALGFLEGVDEQFRKAIAYFEEASALSGDLDLRRRAVFLHALAVAYHETSDIEGAIEAGRESLALYAAADSQHEAALLENQLALAYLASGNAKRAGELAGHARLRHELDGDERAMGHVAETQARIAIAERRYADALQLASESREIAKRGGNHATFAIATLTMGRAQAASGDREAAIESYTVAVAQLRQRGPVARLQQGLGEWAELLAAMGRHEEAYALTREALQAGNTPPDPHSGALRRVRGKPAATPSQPAPKKARAGVAVRRGVRAS
jgi:tetratricopeptide (TPR) repeat protein